MANSQCGWINNGPLVCCPDPLRTQTQQPQGGGGNSLLPQPGVCGRGLDNRIIGGTATGLDEFPWLALLQYFKRKN